MPELISFLGTFLGGLGVGFTLARMTARPEPEPTPPGPNAAYKIEGRTQAVRIVGGKVEMRVVPRVSELAAEIDRMLPSRPIRVRPMHLLGDFTGYDDDEQGA